MSFRASTKYIKIWLVEFKDMELTDSPGVVRGTFAAQSVIITYRNSSSGIFLLVSSTLPPLTRWLAKVKRDFGLQSVID